MKRLLPFLLICFFPFCLFGQDGQTPTPQWRPVYHFTPERNWTNDPNGLIYINGEYHLYNQQNPLENKWGHMSWGHATSKDLVNWKHLPVAIPEKIDKDTTWIFSGCAVWDKNNTSGFCRNGGCLVAIYTADQPNLKRESQFIAYSNDGGMTYTNYKNNPVIDLHKKDFRDPNVFWYAPSRQWVMVVALPKEYKVRFYGSPDLKQWSLLSEFGPQGYTSAAWECPFLIRLPIEGNPGREKWVLMGSAGGPKRGPYMQYFVGEFDGKEFRNDNPSNTVLTVDEGDTFYAAIPWNNMPGGQNLFIGWLVPGPQDTYPWRGQMSIPRDLSLRETKKGVRLVQEPSSIIRNELAGLSGNRFIEMKDMEINGSGTDLDNEGKLKGNAYWLNAEILVGSAKAVGFKIAAKKEKDTALSTETVIGYDAVNHQLYADRSRGGKGKIKKESARQTIDLGDQGDTLQLEILLDRSSLEIFVNKGEKVLSTYIYPDEDAHGLTAFTIGGKATISKLKIWDLSNGGLTTKRLP